MYLLILEATEEQLEQIEAFTSHYVSINSKFGLLEVINTEIFTSHYVSINSGQNQV